MTKILTTFEEQQLKKDGSLSSKADSRLFIVTETHFCRKNIVTCSIA